MTLSLDPLVLGLLVRCSVSHHTTTYQSSKMSHYHKLTKEQPESVKKLNLPGNTSVVLLKKQTIEVRDEPLPILQPDGVLVKVISTDKSPSTSTQYVS
jgi:D-xylulose reductase